MNLKRKELEFKVKRDFIVEKAEHLFEANGIENTKMEDIAKQADYSRKTLYFYFKGRDEICMMVTIKDIEKRWEYQKLMLENAKNGIDKFRIWGESLYEYYKNNKLSLNLQKYWDYNGIKNIKLDKSVFDKFEVLNEKLADGLREIFHEGIKDNSISGRVNVDLKISQFLHSYRSIIFRALSDAYTFKKFDSDEYVKSFLELFINSIAPD